MLIAETTATMPATSPFAPEKPVAITAAVAIIEATDRSSPRTIMTKLWPIATMPSGAICNSRLEMIAGAEKAGEITPPSSSNAGNSRNMPKRDEQRAQRPRRRLTAAPSGGVVGHRSRRSPPFHIDRDREDDDQRLRHQLIVLRDVHEVEEIVDAARSDRRRATCRSRRPALR